MTDAPGSAARTGAAVEDELVRSDDRLRRSLRRFRVISYVVGVLLLLLSLAMVLKYGYDSPELMETVGRVHGFGYMVYLVLGFDLSRIAGWSIPKTAAVLLAGTVPFLSFVAERKVTRVVTDDLEGTTASS